MKDIEFLLNLASRLEILERQSPNLNLHWFDVSRLRLVASELEAKNVQVEGMKAAIEGLLARGEPFSKDEKANVPAPNILASPGFRDGVMGSAKATGTIVMDMQQHALMKPAPMGDKPISLLKEPTPAPAHDPNNSGVDYRFRPQGFA